MAGRLKFVSLVIFAAAVIAFALLSNNASEQAITQVAFHDTTEYITVAKELAGIHNVNVHSGHPFIYPAYLSLFVKLMPAMWAIKFANVLWLIATAVLLLLASRSMKPFLIFAFSPLVLWLSPQVTPVLPAAFFFTLAYLSIKTLETRMQSRWLVICGLSLGLATSTYLPVVLPAGLLLLFFFYSKPAKHLFSAILFGFIGFLPSLALEYYLFHNPIYSLIRYAGAAFTVSTGITNTIGHSAAGGLLSNIGFLLAAVLLLITPLLFLFYKADWRRYWREGLLILLTGLFFLFWAGHWRGIKYFLIIAPMLILVLSTKISRKQLLAGILVSVALAGLMTYGFFGANKPDALLAKDMQDISNDGYEKLITYSGESGTFFSVHLFKNKPFIFWWKEYDAEINNKISFSDYSYVLNSQKISLLEQFQIAASLATKPNDFSGAKFLVKKWRNMQSGLLENCPKREKAPPPIGLALEKCYEEVCIYKKNG